MHSPHWQPADTVFIALNQLFKFNAPIGSISIGHSTAAGSRRGGGGQGGWNLSLESEGPGQRRAAAFGIQQPRRRAPIQNAARLPAGSGPATLRPLSSPSLPAQPSPRRVRCCGVACVPRLRWHPPTPSPPRCPGCRPHWSSCPCQQGHKCTPTLAVHGAEAWQRGCKGLRRRRRRGRGGGGRQEEEKEKRRRGRRAFAHPVPHDVKPRCTPCWGLGVVMLSGPTDATVPRVVVPVSNSIHPPCHGPGHSHPPPGQWIPRSPPSDQGGDPCGMGTAGTLQPSKPQTTATVEEREEEVMAKLPAGRDRRTDMGTEALRGAGCGASGTATARLLLRGPVTAGWRAAAKRSRGGTPGSAPPETRGKRGDGRTRWGFGAALQQRQREPFPRELGMEAAQDEPRDADEVHPEAGAASQGSGGGSGAARGSHHSRQRAPCPHGARRAGGSRVGDAQQAAMPAAPPGPPLTGGVPPSPAPLWVINPARHLLRQPAAPSHRQLLSPCRRDPGN